MATRQVSCVGRDLEGISNPFAARAVARLNMACVSTDLQLNDDTVAIFSQQVIRPSISSFFTGPSGCRPVTLFE